jgi:hypothetical protein
MAETFSPLADLYTQAYASAEAAVRQALTNKDGETNDRAARQAAKQIVMDADKNLRGTTLIVTEDLSYRDALRAQGITPENERVTQQVSFATVLEGHNRILNLTNFLTEHGASVPADCDVFLRAAEWWSPASE